MKRNVSTFATLIECKIAIQKAIELSDVDVELELIDPMSVKYGIGAVEKAPPPKKGKRRKRRKIKEDTKVLVRNKIASLVDLLWDSDIPYIDYLDEHTVDAVSIGYYKASRIAEYLFRLNDDYLRFKQSVNHI